MHEGQVYYPGERHVMITARVEFRREGEAMHRRIVRRCIACPNEREVIVSTVREGLAVDFVHGRLGLDDYIAGRL